MLTSSHLFARRCKDLICLAGCRAHPAPRLLVQKPRGSHFEATKRRFLEEGKSALKTIPHYTWRTGCASSPHSLCHCNHHCSTKRITRQPRKCNIYFLKQLRSGYQKAEFLIRRCCWHRAKGVVVEVVMFSVFPSKEYNDAQESQ